MYIVLTKVDERIPTFFIDFSHKRDNPTIAMIHLWIIEVPIITSVLMPDPYLIFLADKFLLAAW